MMKINIQLSIVFFIITFLFGCANIPANLGITESEWANYSLEKQQTLLSSYESFTEKRNNEKKKIIDVNNNAFLEINIHDGQVMMPPFINWQNYQPVNFVISQEQCRDIVLQHPSNEDYKTELGVCFKGNTLYLDPSHYDAKKINGSISIGYSPLWLSGFVYKKISSSGYTRLNNITIEITMKNAGERT
jgi:hypothetical protein